MRNKPDDPNPHVTPRCAYCGESTGTINDVAIGTPGSFRARTAYLHEGCERGYLRLVDDD